MEAIMDSKDIDPYDDDVPYRGPVSEEVKEQIRKENIWRYFDIKDFTTQEINCIIKRFGWVRIPLIRIRKEISKYEAVGLDTDIAGKLGCLVTIERRWVREKGFQGKQPYPDVYYASAE